MFQIRCLGAHARRLYFVGLPLVMLAGLLAQPTAAQTPQSTETGATVGLLGDPACLRFEGCSAVTEQAVRKALAWDAQVLLHAAPSAPLSEYLTLLAQHLTDTYEANGFPQAKVTAASAPGGKTITINVVEGPRYRNGRISIVGAQGISTDALVKDLTTLHAPERFRAHLLPNHTIRMETCEIDDSAGSSGTVEDLQKQGWPVGNQLNQAPVWVTGRPVDFLGGRNSPLEFALRQFLSVQGFLSATYSVEHPIIGDQADTVIRIDSEGPRATLGQIEITGLAKTSKDDVIRFLGLREGMAVDLTLIRAVHRKLWDSGRFSQHVVFTRDIADAPGKVALCLDLKECAFAPALSAPLSEIDQALLRWYAWMQGWAARGDDLVLTTGTGRQKLFDVVIGGPRGSTVRFYPFVAPPAATQPSTKPGLDDVGMPALRHEVDFVCTPGSIAFFSRSAGRKFVCPGIKAQFAAGLSFLPNSDDPEHPMSMAFDFHFEQLDKSADQAPLQIEVLVAPAAAFYLGRGPGASASIQDGVLTVTRNTDVLRIDVQSGALLEWRGRESATKVYMSLTVEHGVLDRCLDDLAKTPGVNTYDPKRPLGSFVTFTADLVPQLVQWPAGADEVSYAAGALVLARLATSGALTPLEQLLPSMDEADAELFAPPVFHWIQADLETIPRQIILVVGLPWCDRLLSRGSWPWTLARDLLAAQAGMGAADAPEMQRLYFSSQTGPLGCLMAAWYLQACNQPDMAQALAGRGLMRLEEENFRRDLAALLPPDGPLGQATSRLIDGLRHLTPQDQKALEDMMAAPLAVQFRRIMAVLGTEPDKPWSDNAEGHRRLWAEIFRPALESRLGAMARPPATWNEQ